MLKNILRHNFKFITGVCLAFWHIRETFVVVVSHVIGDISCGADIMGFCPTPGGAALLVVISRLLTDVGADETAVLTSTEYRDKHRA